VATVAAFIAFGAGWLADLSNPFWFTLMSLWLFAVILLASFTSAPSRCLSSFFVLARRDDGRE
jgi:hypothetical protein